MKTVIIILLAIASAEFALALADGIIQKGPKGGCYTIVKSKKSGKEYKKYQPCKVVTK